MMSLSKATHTNSSAGSDGKLIALAFILRSRVLKLYRQAWRITRRAPEHAREELRKTTRAEFVKNLHCDDKQKIRFLISEGKQRLKHLDELLDMTGNR